MAGSNMAENTVSLELSPEKSSLSQAVSSGSASLETSSPVPENKPNIKQENLELISCKSVPPPWEECFDLKTLEIYYVNWTNKAIMKEDPRKAIKSAGSYYSEEASLDKGHGPSSASSLSSGDIPDEDRILVLVGCKNCYMYTIVERRVLKCPKCSGPLLHLR
ncbi:protein CURLY FLAG LEAF 1-like [Tasmannia lanceolata]|uniref:protein CURLY FLAG LEAF 1-like n=1 Tax=Tasmannia lanceolata TaxID=3420 RepID=UPI004064ADB8